MNKITHYRLIQLLPELKDVPKGEIEATIECGRVLIEENKGDPFHTITEEKDMLDAGVYCEYLVARDHEIELIL